MELVGISAGRVGPGAFVTPVAAFVSEKQASAQDRADEVVEAVYGAPEIRHGVLYPKTVNTAVQLIAAVEKQHSAELTAALAAILKRTCRGWACPGLVVIPAAVMTEIPDPVVKPHMTKVTCFLMPV